MNNKPLAMTRYPSCDQCSHAAAYPVNTENGLIRLCGGCVADLRMAGHRAEFVMKTRK